MAKATKKSIIAEASLATGIRPDCIEFFKCDGFYYWGGKVGACLTECCVYVTRLDDWSVERWVHDLQAKISESGRADFQAYIDSIEWVE